MSLNNKTTFDDSGKSLFKDYFESSKMDGVSEDSVSSFLNARNDHKYNGIFTIKEKFETNKDEDVASWDISYINKVTGLLVVNFNVQFDKKRNAMYWLKGENIVGHFVAEQFCETFVKMQGGSILLNSECGTKEHDFYFTDEFDKLDDYIHYLFASGRRFSDNFRDCEELIKSHILSNIGEELRDALNEGLSPKASFNI